MQRPAPKLVELVFVGDLASSSLDENAPAGVVERAAVVHFKDHLGTASDGAQFGAGLGAEHDGLIISEVVDRQAHRQPVHHEADSAAIGVQLQELERLGSGERVNSGLRSALHALSSQYQPPVSRLFRLRRAMNAAASARRDSPSFKRMFET